MLYQIKDWNDAYANGAHIPQSDGYLDRWQSEAAAFRQTNPREKVGRGDLFLPDGQPVGLMVFIHGGYWMRFDPSFWSHLAAGGLKRGWAVLMPAYTLAPEARIGQMTQEVARSIAETADRIAGPLAISGHSAGGHLAARMMCSKVLPDKVFDRVVNCLPVSALSDLRPLMRTAMNDTLQLDLSQCQAESPALLNPRQGVPMTAWVGGMERPEFIRQSRLLADVWAGMGVATECVIDPGLHHFNVIDSFCDPESSIMARLLG